MINELSKKVSQEKFELIFKEFMAQADENAKTGKSNGTKKSRYLDNNEFNGAKFKCNYGHGAATKTPHINWWVLSVYYIPYNGRIIMGIEDHRYPYLNKMNPISHKSIENKKDTVAVFYETTKDNVNYKKLYEAFINIVEQITILGVVDNYS